MNHSTPICSSTAFVLIILAAVATRGGAQETIQGPPPGWEICRLTANMGAYMSNSPRMNDRGQIVWATISGWNPWIQDIYLYDNGRITRITDTVNMYQPDPFIGEDGTIVWSRRDLTDPDDMTTDILRYRHGVTEYLTSSDSLQAGASIARDGTIFWSHWYAEGWAELVRFQDGIATEITSNGFSNQQVRANSATNFVWMRGNFFVSPWVSTIMLSQDDETVELTDGSTTVFGTDMNGNGNIVWSAGWPDNRVYCWENGNTSVVAEQALGAWINDNDDVLMVRENGEPTETLLLRNGAIYQLSDPSIDWKPGTLNNRGEVVLTHGETFETAVDVYLLWKTREFGDFDNSGAIDALDFQSYLNCATGPTSYSFVPETCRRVFDADKDGDIDFHDLGRLQIAVGTGSKH